MSKFRHLTINELNVISQALRAMERAPIVQDLLDNVAEAREDMRFEWKVKEKSQ